MQNDVVDSSDIESMLNTMDFPMAYNEGKEESYSSLKRCWEAVAELVYTISKELEELKSITSEVESIIACERDYSQENLVTYIEVLSRTERNT